MKTKLLIEQHFHGAFGIDFNKAGIEDILFVAREIYKYGIGGIFPTLVTDNVRNTKQAIWKIKEAAKMQTSDMAKILGVHLEGIFLNPEKKGIHNPAHFLAPAIDNYRLIEDDFIKIVTLAPELVLFSETNDENRAEKYSTTTSGKSNLIDYLHSKSVKVQAGHCIGGDLNGCDGTTHTFNAMSGICHRGKSTALSALINDEIYTEIIADGIHVSDDAIKLLFKAKPADKIILVSDCLPCVHSKLKKFIFADETVYYDGTKAASKDGTIAGSTSLLPEIIKRLASKGLFNPHFIENPYNYHNIDLAGEIEWDENFNIINIK